MHIASLHDGYERRGLVSCQLLVANRRLRAWFLCNVDDRRTQGVHPVAVAAGVDRGSREFFLCDQLFHVISHVMEFLCANHEIDVR